MSLVLRESSRSPVRLRDCKGSRIYCHCVLYLRYSRSQPSSLSAEACFDMFDTVCSPLLPDIQFFLSPIPLSHVPEENIDFINRDSNATEVAAGEGAVKEVPETGTSRSSQKVGKQAFHTKLCDLDDHRTEMADDANAAENVYGHGAQRHDASTDGSRRSSENSGAEGAVNDSTAALFDKVDGWMQSMEESEKRACDMAQETAELKNHLERLLSEIVTTRNQMCPRAPHSTHSSRCDIAARPPRRSVLGLGCNAKFQKDSCCENQSLSEYLVSSNEDEYCERFGSVFSASCETDGSGTYLEDTFSESDTDPSDVEMDFEEDVEMVLQSIWTTTSVEETNENVNSYSPQTDTDLMASNSDLDFIPEALKSAYDMDTPRPSSPEEAMKCSARNEEMHMPESGNTRNTSSLCSNKRERHKGSRSSENSEVAQPLGDTLVSDTTDEDGISSTMKTKAQSNECFQEAASVSCRRESCPTEFQTMNKTEEVGNKNQEVLVVSHEEEAAKEDCIKENQTSRLDIASLEIRRCRAVIDPTPREYLGKTRVTAKGKAEGWSSTCLEIFKEERSMDDATLLAECEKHLNSPVRSSAFRFLSWWTSKKSPNYTTRGPTACSSAFMAFGSEESTPKVVTEFSKQCQKWSRLADKKRSFFGFFLPSFR